MIQTDYIELASTTFSKLFEGLDALADGSTYSRRKALQESLVDEIRLLWTRIAWADGRLSEGEEELFHCLIETAREKGVAFSPDRQPDLETLPVFLRAASEKGSLTAAHMISQLETVGFALLASDGKVCGAELQQLGDYLHQRREQVFAVSRSAERSIQLAHSVGSLVA